MPFFVVAFFVTPHAISHTHASDCFISIRVTVVIRDSNTGKACTANANWFWEILDGAEKKGKGDLTSRFERLNV